MKIENIADRLIQKANRSNCKYKIAAIGLDKRSRPLAIKFNMPRFNKKGGGVHAEQRIMRSAPPNLYRIVIVRVGSRGNCLPIDPCDICKRMASRLGIKIETLKNS